MFILGDPEAVVGAFQNLKPSLEKINLSICDEKCQAYSSNHTNWSSNIKLTTVGMEILGVPIGNADYVSSCCSVVAPSGIEFCSELSQLNDPQCDYFSFSTVIHPV
jgi:hypothetical protein